MGPSELALATTMICRLCPTLAFLHGEGLVHRDLKPDNILISESGWPILVDFGLAISFAGETNRETLIVEHGAAGTLNYMAPEQIAAESIDARADLYSLGCILYELLVGHPPFVGSTTTEVVRAHLHAEPVPISKFRPDIPAEIDDLVIRLLIKDPGRRPGHADIIATILSHYGEGLMPGLILPKAKAYFYRSRFVGRQTVLDSIRRTRGNHDTDAGSDSSQGGITIVGGEAGSGKTRLVMEYGRELTKRGFLVLTGDCSGLSFQPLSALLRPLRVVADLCRESGLAETEHIVGPRGKVLAHYESSLALLPGQERYPEPESLPLADARLRLFHALCGTFQALAERQPVALILDDVHEADELLLGYLHYQSRILADEKCSLQVLLTYRSGDCGSDLTAIIDRAGSDHFILEGLDEHSTAMVVGDMLAIIPPPEIFSRFLWEKSAGNPLFVSEYLRIALQAGMIGRDNRGRWEITATVDQSLTLEETLERLSLPESLQELIQTGIDDLPLPAKKVLTTAAIIGRESSIPLIWEVLGLVEESEILGAFDILFRRQLMEKRGQDGIRFIHNQLRDLAIASLPESERVSRHRAVADSIEKLYADRLDEHQAALGHHREVAGQVDLARPCFIAAGRRARDRYDNREADRLYRSFIRLTLEPSADLAAAHLELGRDVLSPVGRIEDAAKFLGEGLRIATDLHDLPRQSEALTAMGQLYIDTGRFELAEESLSKALIIARESGDRGAEGRSLNSLGVLHQIRGTFDQGIELIEQAVDIARETGEKTQEALRLANLAQLRRHVGQTESAESLYLEALQGARQTGQRKAEAAILGSFAQLQSQLGRDEESIRSLLRAVELTRETGDRRREGWFLGNLAFAHHGRGDFDQARLLVEQALTIALHIGDRPKQVTWHGFLAVVHLAQGRFDEAVISMRKAVETSREIGDQRQHAFMLGQLGGIHIERGDHDQAAQLLAEALAIARNVKYQLVESDVLRLMGELQTKLNQRDKARQCLEQALAHAEAGHQLGLKNHVLMDLAILERRLERPTAESARRIGQILEFFEKLQQPIETGICLCELGHHALLTNSSAESFLSKARAIARRLNLTDNSSLSKAIRDLCLAEQAYQDSGL
jgi:eukaryotic-like serine/threonine-protein kinase